MMALDYQYTHSTLIPPTRNAVVHKKPLFVFWGRQSGLHGQQHTHQQVPNGKGSCVSEVSNQGYEAPYFCSSIPCIQRFVPFSCSLNIAFSSAFSPPSLL